MKIAAYQPATREQILSLLNHRFNIRSHFQERMSGSRRRYLERKGHATVNLVNGPQFRGHALNP